MRDKQFRMSRRFFFSSLRLLHLLVPFVHLIPLLLRRATLDYATWRIPRKSSVRHQCSVLSPSQRGKLEACVTVLRRPRGNAFAELAKISDQRQTIDQSAAQNPC